MMLFIAVSNHPYACFSLVTMKSALQLTRKDFYNFTDWHDRNVLVKDTSRAVGSTYWRWSRISFFLQNLQDFLIWFILWWLIWMRMMSQQTIDNWVATQTIKQTTYNILFTTMNYTSQLLVNECKHTSRNYKCRSRSDNNNNMEVTISNISLESFVIQGFA